MFVLNILSCHQVVFCHAATKLLPCLRSRSPSLCYNDQDFVTRIIKTSFSMLQILLGVTLLLALMRSHRLDSRLFKEYASEIAPVLTLIFQASLDQSALPAAWKNAWVTPFSFIRSTILPLASASGSDCLHCGMSSVEIFMNLTWFLSSQYGNT